ncbi:hypothetical protein [Desulfonatronovibrio hydrogenovorans]|uniref:hypothetical protein n=1 Tax=Desulfonatronovibrio hydrogenovorans TaxID=53245 RepID=UPI00048AFD87|nr:hypothetical protein [Desulfonatronovibrio hydrogenovorans]
MTTKQVQPLYNQAGQLQGVFIPAEIWFKHENNLEKILFPEAVSQPEIPAEPINDWKQFLSFWDFNYPVEKGVKCDHCGCSTPDWTADDPKRFLLKAASLGGMVSFLCLECQYRVTKKHFKDHVVYECTPFTCRV